MAGRPFEHFLRDALSQFETALRAKGMRQGDIEDCLRCAQEFAVFILGAPLPPSASGNGGRSSSRDGARPRSARAARPSRPTR